MRLLAIRIFFKRVKRINWKCVLPLLLPSPKWAFCQFAKCTRKMQPSPKLLAWVQQWQPATGSKTCVNGQRDETALKSPIAVHPHGAGKSKEISRAADEAGACACSGDIPRALEAQFLVALRVPGSCKGHSWQKFTYWSCPDSGDCWQVSASSAECHWWFSAQVLGGQGVALHVEWNPCSLSVPGPSPGLAQPSSM